MNPPGDASKRQETTGGDSAPKDLLVEMMDHPSTTRLRAGEIFRRRLLEFRRVRGWSQPDLVRRLAREHDIDWHPTTLSKVEKGDRGITLDEAVAIASVFDVSLDQMLTLPRRDDELVPLREEIRDLQMQAASVATDFGRTTEELRSFELESRSLQDRMIVAEKRREQLARELDNTENALARAYQMYERLSTRMADLRAAPLDKESLAAAVMERYKAGESIRSLARSTGRSYGFIHRVLTEAGIQLRHQPKG